MFCQNWNCLLHNRSHKRAYSCIFKIIFAKLPVSKSKRLQTWSRHNTFRFSLRASKWIAILVITRKGSAKGQAALQVDIVTLNVSPEMIFTQGIDLLFERADLTRGSLLRSCRGWNYLWQYSLLLCTQKVTLKQVTQFLFRSFPCTAIDHWKYDDATRCIELHII